MNPKLSLVIGILFISFSPIFVKWAEATPAVCGFYRIACAWVCLLPYCLYKGNLQMARKDMLLALLGGLIFACDVTVWNVSIKMISATVSTLLANLAPVWVGLLSYLLFRKKSGWLFWLGTGIAIVGMIILVGINQVMQLQFSLGVVLAVAASMLYAVYMLVSKDVLKRIATLPFMFYSMLCSTVFLLLLCVFLGDNLLHFNAKTWWSFAGMGIICQLAGWITINYAISKLESTKVSIALLSQTVTTGILAALLLHESLETKEIIGSVVVLAGIGMTFLKLKQTVAHSSS
ncbi:DMT family transporter [Mucilaginibacter antarcticus]|uniref:DMT family transporter n=1 Tax=Mucilaginibacter antarcticus TaxID=1855725 RepID=A0ABW5XNV6_9SPHI